MESGGTIVVVILFILVIAALIAGFHAQKKESVRRQAKAGRRRAAPESPTSNSSGERKRGQDPEVVRTRLKADYASLDEARAEQHAFESRSLIGELHARTGNCGLHHVETAADIQVLLRVGAPINGAALIDYDDAMQHWETPLLTALVDERWSAARELIRLGADVEAPNAVIAWTGGGFGHSALHTMVSRMNHDGVQILISAGADVNRQTTLGSTPLYFAASVDDPQLVSLLLGAGARPQIRDLEGEIPVGIAGPRTRHLFG